MSITFRDCMKIMHWYLFDKSEINIAFICKICCVEVIAKELL